MSISSPPHRSAINIGRSRSRSITQAKVLGVRGTMLHDTGAYLPWGVVMPFIAATTVPGPYVVPAYELERHGRLHQQGADHAGQRRRPAAGGVRHGAAPGSGRARARARSRRDPPPKSDPGGADAVSRGSHLPRRQAGRLRQRRLSGDAREGARAFALSRIPTPSEGGAGARAAISASASALTSKAPGSAPSRASRVRMQENGKVLVKSGAAPHGQGHQTMFQQIVAR